MIPAERDVSWNEETVNGRSVTNVYGSPEQADYNELIVNCPK